MIKPGDCVKYVRQIRSQICDNNTDILFLGDIYYVEHIELCSKHTQIKLRGIKGKFDFSCFEVIKK